MSSEHRSLFAAVLSSSRDRADLRGPSRNLSGDASTPASPSADAREKIENQTHLAFAIDVGLPESWK